MILGIDVAFIHSPHRALADWYAEVLGLPKGYGDDGWQSFEVSRRLTLCHRLHSLSPFGSRKAGDHPQLQGRRHPPGG